MTPLQNMPGKIVGADTDRRTITIQIPFQPEVTTGDSVIVSSVPEIAPLVGDVDRQAAAAFFTFVSDARLNAFDIQSIRELAIAFARHRENATR